MKSLSCASVHTKELIIHFLLTVLEVTVKVNGLQSGGVLQLHIIAPESVRPAVALRLLVHVDKSWHYACASALE